MMNYLIMLAIAVVAFGCGMALILWLLFGNPIPWRIRDRWHMAGSRIAGWIRNVLGIPSW